MSDEDLFSKVKKIKSDFINLFGSTDKFMDKEATIKEYWALVPEENRPYAASYDDLYEIALRYVAPQDFKENTKDQNNYFHDLSKDEGIIAVLIGILAYAIAREVDTQGKALETAIDDMLPDRYDTNNPFDVKRGYGHRIFGHDPMTFGVRNIPGDLGISVTQDGVRKTIRVCDLLNVTPDAKVTMWDIIWKFYGNPDDRLTGVINCLSHTIVHFGKDILTPAGLPLPFTSLVTEYQKIGNGTLSYIQYKDSVMQKVDNLHMQMKASDFASFFFIELFTKIYADGKEQNEHIKNLKQEMRLLAMGTCISMQMTTLIFGINGHIGLKGNQGMIPGGKLNLLMTGDFMKIAVQQMISIEKAHRDILNEYKRGYEGRNSK